MEEIAFFADKICPQCKAVGTLSVTTKFYAKPIGSYSIAGAQPKIVGEFRPVLLCANPECGLEQVGAFGEDGFEFPFGASA